ncbi:MAG: hypothetical protein ABEJ28_08675 [Salinigranum sp.]
MACTRGDALRTKVRRRWQVGDGSRAVDDGRRDVADGHGEVVVVEGTAEKLTGETAEPALLERLDEAYEAKYGAPHGTPLFRVSPETVLAWSDFPADATRWRFREGRARRE